MKKLIPWVLVVCVLALLGAGVWRGMRTQQQKQQALEQAEQAKAQALYQLAPSDVLTATQQQLPLTLPISGTVQAVNTATIKARMAGEIQQLQLREGDAVTAGQVVARIDSTESQARLAQAQQQADAARAQRDIQQRQFDNNRALVDQGFISSTALQASQSQLQAAQSNYQAALSAAQVLKKNLSDTVLYSPISGQVAKKWVSNGEKVGPDVQVLEVVDLSQLELKVQLSPADSLQVQPGQRALLRVEGSEQTVNATVARINPEADTASRSIAAYLRLQPAPQQKLQQQLRQGLYLQGQLQIGAVDALAVPLSAVRTDQPEPYVQLLVPQGEHFVLRHQPVQLGSRALQDGTTWVEISQGLQAQQQVLSGQVGQLRAGTLVRLPAPAPAAAASNAPEAATSKAAP
ncbi:efflux RND transporter periplasmic adaptor subunit [Comamonas sp. J-3]|uniref:efflux RND transporter periplasmic adaptor subunit n=1 Tax=Comamonas trifloxystrobinivorans TaxID=3350256 RepID=UPI00372C5B1D